MIATMARSVERTATRDMIAEAISMCYGHPGVDCYLGRTPFDRVQKSTPIDVNIDAFADAIETSNSYASFVEVELMSRFLKKRDVALVIVPSERSLAGNASDLAGLLRKVEERRVLILVNHGGSHYDRATYDGRTLPKAKTLRAMFSRNA